MFQNKQSKQIVEEFFNKKQSLKEDVEQIIKRILAKSPKNLDVQMQELHYKVFEEINCLDCAACCKNLSPAVKDSDIERLSKYLKMKPSALVEKYFKIDSDGDYVFTQSPCPFLDTENYCLVYDARPRACREYPHTDRRRSLQIIKLTQKNAEVCPAVYHVLKGLKL